MMKIKKTHDGQEESIFSRLNKQCENKTETPYGLRRVTRVHSIRKISVLVSTRLERPLLAPVQSVRRFMIDQLVSF